MNLLRRQIGTRSLWHRCCALVALLSYLSTVFAFPVPVPRPKETGQPFPCQNRPCGCQTAEQFWLGCCCLTPEQRWAWAMANHVEPPSYVQPPSSCCRTTSCCEKEEKREEPKSCCKGSGKPCTCGEKNKKKSSCCSSGKSEQKSCCSSKKSGRHSGGCCPTPHNDENKSKESGAKLQWFPGMTALQCRGVSMLWISTGAVLPPPMPLVWQPHQKPAGWVVECPAVLKPFVSSPPVPPPRFPFAEN